MLTWWYLRQLRSTDSSTRTRARKRLIARKAAWGKAAWELIPMLKDPVARSDAIAALRSMGGAATVFLGIALKNPDQRIRTGAALCRDFDADGVEALIELLRDQQADPSEAEHAARALGKFRQTKVLVEAVESGNVHAIAGLWESDDAAAFFSVMKHLQSSSGPARDAAALQLGTYAYRRLFIETFNWVIWDEDEAVWIRVFGEGLLKLPASERVACYRALIYRSETGVIYGAGDTTVRLSEGCERVLAAAVQELGNTTHSSCPQTIVERLNQLASYSSLLRDVVGRALKTVQKRARQLGEPPESAAQNA